MKKFFIPPNAPPPLTVQPYTIRTQKDSVEFVSTPKRLIFDDIETAPKMPIRTRQGDSMTTHVNRIVNTPVVTPPAQITDGVCRGTGNFAPIPQNYGHVSSDHQIAQLPSDFRGNPHAVVIDAPQEIFIGMQRPKQAPQMPTDMNALLPCGNGYAPIKASDLVNPHYRQAPPITY